MATIPTNGARQPVVITNNNGQQAALTFDGAIWRLAVDAAVVLPPIASVAINDAGAGTTELSVKVTGTAIPVTDGGALIAGRDPGGIQRDVAVDVTGKLLAVASDATPGTDITTQADTAIAPLATTALPVVPANTRRMTIQNTTTAGSSRLRIREVGGVAGAGILLGNFSSITLGGSDGAVENMEAENVSGPAATVAVLFERD